MDLRDACYGERQVGARRLRALVVGLPAGCAMHRAADPDSWSWTYTEELLASLIEVVDAGNRLFVRANSKKGAKAPPAIEVKRPWVKESKKGVKRRQASASEIMAFVAKAGGRG